MQDISMILDKVHRYISITDYLTKAPHGGYVCPFCGSGSGKKGTGGLHVFADQNRFHCFACGQSGDAIDILMHTEHISWMDALRQAVEDGGLSIDDFSRRDNALSKQSVICAEYSSDDADADYTAYYIRCASRLTMPESAAYLKSRGISLETAQDAGLGFDPEADPAFNPGAKGRSRYPQPRIIIPTSTSHYIARAINDDADFPKMNPKGTSAGLFNAQALITDGRVIIVEGAFDALSVIEAGGRAVALNSASNWKFITELLASTGKRPEVVISLDNDRAGKNASGRLAESLKKSGIRYAVKDISCGCKDPNEALQKHPDEFSSLIQYMMEDEDAFDKTPDDDDTAVFIDMDSAASRIKILEDEIRRSALEEEPHTGFLGIDGMCDGGLYSGLYILGGVSSVGKTSLLLQMADNIAAAGTDVLFFTLEMSEKELMFRSLSRLTYEDHIASGKKGAPKTMLDILDGKRYAGYSKKDLAAIDRAKQSYVDRMKHLFFIEGDVMTGVDEVRSRISRHISVTGKHPVVFIDYIQILAAGTARYSDKQSMDITVSELKRISRDFNIPVIAVSSLNRDSYRQKSTGEVLMSNFKESGNIEYSADVLWALQFTMAGKKGFDELAEKDRSPREVSLVVLKNRNMVSGIRDDFRYYPAYNFFEEIKHPSIPKADDEKNTPAKDSSWVMNRISSDSSIIV